MKRVTILTLTLAMILGAISVAAGYSGSYSDGKQVLSLSKNESGWIFIESAKGNTVKVSTKSEGGKVSIKVFDSKSNRIVSGMNKLSFKSQSSKEKYKIQITNKGSKTETVEVSFLTIEKGH